MHKTTAIAPTNIAFIKFMGKDPRGAELPNDQGLNFPENGSISMCLDGLYSKTTVEFSDSYDKDIFILDGEEDAVESERTFAQINRIRRMAGIDLPVRIESMNNFGKSRGLSSSASGFAALSMAAAHAAGLNLSINEMSALARKGSGSASRSIPDGFTEWKSPVFGSDGSLIEDSYAETIYSPDHWDICDVVAVTKTPAKKVSTTQAHGCVSESRYRDARLAVMPEKIERCRSLLDTKDFTALGELIEEEAWDLHLLFISSGIRYLQPETIAIMNAVEAMRPEIPAYYTLNTGQDIHVICEGKNVETVADQLRNLEEVTEVMIARPGKGARLIDEHLY